MAKKKPGQDASDEVLRQWAKVKRDILPPVMANTAKEAFIDNFNKEGFFGQGWEEPNSEGRERPGLPTLEQSGDLRGGIEVLKTAFNDIRVGVVGLLYADIHNEGGDIPVTAQSKRFFWAKFKETGKAFWRNMALNSSGKVTIPQRQFIGNSKKLTDLLVKDIETELKRLGR